MVWYRILKVKEDTASDKSKLVSYTCNIQTTEYAINQVHMLVMLITN